MKRRPYFGTFLVGKYSKGQESLDYHKNEYFPILIPGIKKINMTFYYKSLKNLFSIKTEVSVFFEQRFI